MRGRVAIEPRTIMVLVKPHEIQETLDGGVIVIPPDTQSKLRAAVTEGEVIAIGPDAWCDFKYDKGAKVGDWVAFAQYSGFEVRDKKTKQRYLLINDMDIKATLKRS